LHATGTIAALDNDVGVVGVCPGCNLHIVRVFGEDGEWAYSSTLVNAAVKCKDAGANIISMSLGGNDFSRIENKVFENLWEDNILLVAAAGNDGNKELSYPASYESVMSVAAIDEHSVIADISQQNADVEISAPGVGVESSVMMGSGYVAFLNTADGSTYDATNMEGSELKVLQAELFDCGFGDAVCTGATGMICLMQRGGNITFSVKVENCHNGGGIGAVVFNNEPGPFSGTLGDDWTINTTAYAVTDEIGSELLGLVGTGTVVTFDGFKTNYDAKDGTSMATPHVAGVAGLVWSYDSTKSAQDIRNVLTATALDLGTAGRDNAYGFGLVHACDAAQALGATGLSCSAAVLPPPQ
jgi:serine protease